MCACAFAGQKSISDVVPQILFNLFLDIVSPWPGVYQVNHDGGSIISMDLPFFTSSALVLRLVEQTLQTTLLTEPSLEISRDSYLDFQWVKHSLSCLFCAESSLLVLVRSQFISHCHGGHI